MLIHMNEEFRILSIEALCNQPEGQTFERKSIRVEPKALAVPVIALANADGGTLVVGLDDKDGSIEGIIKHERHLNDLLRAPYDFCRPSVKAEIHRVACVNRLGEPDQVLVMHISQSMSVHANQADEVYYRVGDSSRKLSFNERMHLMYDKGEMLFEKKPIPRAKLTDIDWLAVESYATLSGYTGSPLEFLRDARNYIHQEGENTQITAAALLLFGLSPQRFFPRAQVRVIRFEGSSERTGAQMNVVKDQVFVGTILQMIKQTLDFISSQLRDFTCLNPKGLFITTPEYPVFAWQEIVLNSIVHRDYAIHGTDIQVKLFDDRMVVESPGVLPSLVRIDTLRQVHFSRNPAIAAFLRTHKFVREFGEGIDRMFREMNEAGLPDPEYRQQAFMTIATLRNGRTVLPEIPTKTEGVSEYWTHWQEEKLLSAVRENVYMTLAEVSRRTGYDGILIQELLARLRQKGVLDREEDDLFGRWILL
jgi:ATP-dependent DNA helicase RecG